MSASVDVHNWDFEPFSLSALWCSRGLLGLYYETVPDKDIEQWAQYLQTTPPTQQYDEEQLIAPLDEVLNAWMHTDQQIDVRWHLRNKQLLLEGNAPASQAGFHVGAAYLPVVWSPPTSWRLQVWQAIATIPWGQTVTYSQIAAIAGSLTASRAVGDALRNNPWPLLLPCHRVVGKDSLGGYGGGSSEGQARKRWLLAREGVQWQPSNISR